MRKKIFFLLITLTRDTGTLFIMNDRIDIALASDADGVHLGQDDLPLTAAREIFPRPFIIGISVSSVDEAVQAERYGADYVAVGPIYATRSKDDAGPGVGVDMVRLVREKVSLPIVVIGGINIHNVSDVIGAGADGIAVISAVVSDPDTRGATEKLKSFITGCKSESIL